MYLELVIMIKGLLENSVRVFGFAHCVVKRA